MIKKPALICAALALTLSLGTIVGCSPPREPQPTTATTSSATSQTAEASPTPTPELVEHNGKSFETLTYDQLLSRIGDCSQWVIEEDEALPDGYTYITTLYEMDLIRINTEELESALSPKHDPNVYVRQAYTYVNQYLPGKQSDYSLFVRSDIIRSNVTIWSSELSPQSYCWSAWDEMYSGLVKEGKIVDTSTNDINVEHGSGEVLPTYMFEEFGEQIAERFDPSTLRYPTADELNYVYEAGGLVFSEYSIDKSEVAEMFIRFGDNTPAHLGFSTAYGCLSRYDLRIIIYSNALQNQSSTNRMSVTIHEWVHQARKLTMEGARYEDQTREEGQTVLITALIMRNAGYASGSIMDIVRETNTDKYTAYAEAELALLPDGEAGIAGLIKQFTE